ncbi:hypothetical protein PoB_006766200 [Plakobranchus ocellatus]|uniref:Uncharacterized protein n=1 Tax=Plakobranchus ocellatus TaxID=259542 RepID=A0AAV4DAC6_9GAST|nr:hypothetical protein PoB_006766200 [Plakobranchus ocellatus]
MACLVLPCAPNSHCSVRSAVWRSCTTVCFSCQQQDEVTMASVDTIKAAKSFDHADMFYFGVPMCSTDRVTLALAY